MPKENSIHSIRSGIRNTFSTKVIIHECEYAQGAWSRSKSFSQWLWNLDLVQRADLLNKTRTFYIGTFKHGSAQERQMSLSLLFNLRFDLFHRALLWRKNSLTHTNCLVSYDKKLYESQLLAFSIHDAPIRL